jgi:hypothetical protein
MPVRSIKNQYVGVNAHLHSDWQAEGGWSGFHALYMGQLLLNHQTRLFENGYVADLEQSLQIRRVGESSSLPKADMLVYDTQPFTSATRLHGQTIPLTEAMPDDTAAVRYRAVVIYELDRKTLERGVPVAWIELLSPSNKGSTRDAHVYTAKRRDLLDSGLVFVEIDYLNETPPTLQIISAEQPYRALIIDPRPRFVEGVLHFEVFAVDDPLPTLRVPLNRGDVLELDCHAPYQTVYERALYGLQHVDYTQYPLNFDRYTPADQARVANRMVAVLEAARGGLDLESGPFPAKTLSLDDARAHIELLTHEV